MALVVGCSTEGKGPAEPCEETSECDGTLACLPFTITNNGTCMVVGDTCSTECETNADCADLGADFMCFGTCDTRKVCLKTE